MNNRVGVLRLSSRFVGNRGRLIVNAAWAVVLATLSVTGVALVAGSARAWILFYDGDSVLPVLMARDFFGGVPLHYVFSAVLFVPELTVYFAVAALHLGTQPTIVIVGVIWLLLIGSGFRLAVRWAIPVGDSSYGRTPPQRRFGDLSGTIRTGQAESKPGPSRAVTTIT